jgi:hypothetical protein
MAYVVPRKNGRWELRESTAGAHGPRSRTLVSFSSFGPSELGAALERARVPVEAAELVAAAKRAGAPVEATPAETAAAALLGALARGESLPRRWRSALSDLLGSGSGVGSEPRSVSDAERSAAAWADATLQARGEALRDLLLLADRTGRRPRPERERFPGLVTTGS